MYWDGWIIPMPVSWLLLGLALIGSCAALVSERRRRDSALHALKDEFSRGEIGDAEFKARREAILLL